MFIITGLNPGRDLRLLVVGVNKNGRSEATVLEGFTTKVAQLQVGESVSLLIFLMHLLLTIQFKLMFPIVHTYLLPSEISDARQQKYDSFHTWVGQVQGWSWE